MKKNLLQKFNYAFLAMFLLFSSCQLDEEPMQIPNNNENILPYFASKVSHNELAKNKLLIDKLSNIY